MKTNQLILLSLFLLMPAIHTLGQQPINPKTDKVSWNIIKVQDRQTLQTRTETYSIVTGSAFIELVFGQTSRKFDVLSIAGNWTDVSADGILTYSIKFGDKVGQAILVRSGEEISLSIDFSAYKGGLNQKYFIKDYLRAQ